MPRDFHLLRKAKPQPEDTFVVSELKDTSIVLRRVPELCTKPSRLRRFKQRLTEGKRNTNEMPSYTMPQIQCAAYTHFQGELRYHTLNSISLVPKCSRQNVENWLNCFFSCGSTHQERLHLSCNWRIKVNRWFWLLASQSISPLAKCSQPNV